MAAARQTPSILEMRSVTLCGVLWIVGIDEAGRVDTVNINGKWLGAREALRDTLVDWIERTMLADESVAA